MVVDSLVSALRKQGHHHCGKKQRGIENVSQRAAIVPQAHITVEVRCERFRCLGYLDFQGKWRSAFSGRELPEVLEFERV